MKIRKVVITAAGMGTRFLPITKSVPKEMLPILNRPLVDYVVEEAIRAGIEEIILVTAEGKQATEDYFRRCESLEQALLKQGKRNLLREVVRVSDMGTVSSVRQKAPLGLGHAVLSAREAVGNEPFAVILPDDIIDNTPSALAQLVSVFAQVQSSVLAVEQITPAETVKYGIIDPEEVGENLYRVKTMVEKPEPAAAPSNLGIIGRYLLTPAIFDALEDTPPGKGGEIQLTDALERLLAKEPVFACRIQGTRYDTGTPAGWLKANIAYAMKDEAMAGPIREFMGTIGKSA